MQPRPLSDYVIFAVFILGAFFVAQRLFPKEVHTLTHNTIFVPDQVVLYGMQHKIDSLAASDAFHYEQWSLERRRGAKVQSQVARLAAIVEALRDSVSTNSTVPNFYASYDTSEELSGEDSFSGAKATVNVRSMVTYDIVNDLFRDKKMEIQSLKVDFLNPETTNTEKTSYIVPSIPWIIGGVVTGAIIGGVAVHNIH